MNSLLVRYRSGLNLLKLVIVISHCFICLLLEDDSYKELVKHIKIEV